MVNMAGARRACAHAVVGLALSITGSVTVACSQTTSSATRPTDHTVSDTPAPATAATITTAVPAAAGTTIAATLPTATLPAPVTVPTDTTVPILTVPVVTVPVVTVPVATTVPAPGASSAPPQVDAAAYAVYDATASRWLAERDADVMVAVGSVMKLLTAHVVMQAGDPTDLVTVPELSLDPEESAIGLYTGEQQQRDVLLRAMLIVSANDAARALAIDVAGTEAAFTERMNAAADALGLAGTVAANPVGLDAPGAGSTARDVVTLASLLLQDPTFRETVARPSARLHGQTFPATNDLLATYDGATGVKSGRTTQAGWCLVGSAERDGRSVVVAVLGAPSDAARLASTVALLDWAFAQP
jgi:D-alanyl-D-alanine carboxypeptidase (penicillin-binding protein 5/6)